jgi:3-methyladenine DNA glycosylase AlkD
MKKQKIQDIIRKLKSESNPDNLEGMGRFGINVKNALGVSIPKLRKIAKQIGKDHKLALELWKSKIHEARILAAMIDDPDMVSEGQLEKWVKDFDSWDLCDCCCGNLFDRTRFAYRKAVEWPKRKEEYVKRAGFTLMACLAVHNKKMADKDFTRFFPIIERESTDERNFVKKAVNWALRQIGKRNKKLNKNAIASCKLIAAKDSRSARWIASDAIRELTGKAVQGRLNGGN